MRLVTIQYERRIPHRTLLQRFRRATHEHQIEPAHWPLRRQRALITQLVARAASVRFMSWRLNSAGARIRQQRTSRSVLMPTGPNAFKSLYVVHQVQR